MTKTRLMVFSSYRTEAPMATSTLYQSSPLGSPSGSPRSCLYLSRPKADWHASFTKPTLPLVVHHNDGVWLSTNCSKEPCPQSQPRMQSAPLKDVIEEQTWPPRTNINLGCVSKVLQCHVCQTTTKEHYFHRHLFFGAVQCDLCDLVCTDCHTFAKFTVGSSKKTGSCKHSFSFSEDPYEYLLPRLSGGANNDVGSSVALPSKLRSLQYYVNQLINVQLEEPWCTAIRQCKSRLLKFRTGVLPELAKNTVIPKDPFNTNGNLGVEDRGNGTPASSIEYEWDRSSRMAPERIPTPVIVQHKSQEESNVEDGLLLPQTYDLEHLEQAVEYVQVEKHLNLDVTKDQIKVPGKPKKRRKVSHYKKMKSQRLTPHRKRRQPSLPEEKVNEEYESDLVMADVALPEDGYYLMVQEVIEECPMCYTLLPSELCTVNVKTLLITVSCSECNLRIFIVPDLPGGLQIVTDTTSGNAIKETKKTNHPKPRRIQPRDFFAK